MESKVLANQTKRSLLNKKLKREKQKKDLSSCQTIVQFTLKRIGLIERKVRLNVGYVNVLSRVMVTDSAITAENVVKLFVRLASQTKRGFRKMTQIFTRYVTSVISI